MLTETTSRAPAHRAAATQQEFRNAMARIAATVHIVTTDGEHGYAGFSASAVCSITDTPPTVLVCLNRGSSAYATTVGNGIVCINTLAADQQEMSAAFAGKTPMPERFSHGSWTRCEGYAPALDGAAMSLHCKIIGSSTVGTHDVLLCEVLHIDDRDIETCLLYYQRRYHALSS
ncbi:flavin reductase [Cupriavidus basilensis]|uniref:flavin reductase n=1 Tax=Cupriavidus basilensis TaxID=68895 RepID=UPI0007515B5F|nr:flavin reductase [Cupriavidus basilensis]